MADRLSVQYNAGAQIPMICSVAGTRSSAMANRRSRCRWARRRGASVLLRRRSYCPSRLQTAQQLATFSSGVSLVQADNDITTNAYRYNDILMNATGVGDGTADGISDCGRESIWSTVEAGCADDAGAGGAGCQAADFLCGRRGLRYARQPDDRYRQRCCRNSVRRWCVLQATEELGWRAR